MIDAFRFSETLNLVSMAGEYERQVSGIYDNYPDIPFRDASMFVPSVLSDWLLFYDVSYRYLMSHQTFSLMKFFPFVSVAAHLLCAVNRLVGLIYLYRFSFKVFLHKRSVVYYKHFRRSFLFFLKTTTDFQKKMVPVEKPAALLCASLFR